MKTKYIFFGVLTLFMSVYSCKPHLSSHTSSPIIKDETELKRTAMILLNITNDDGQYATSITNSKIIETTKKLDDHKSDKWHENDFVCFILDNQKNTLDTLLIFQPLHPRFEYPNENNDIGSKVIEHKSSDVMLRFSYSSTMKYLRIEKVEANHKLKLIDILEIPVIQ